MSSGCSNLAVACGNRQGNSELTVIDYIGNHKVFLVKVRSLLQPLLGCGESRADLAAAMRLVEQGRIELPEGCHVTYELEAIDIIRSLLPPGPDAILTFYDDFRQRKACVHGSGVVPVPTENSVPVCSQ